MNNKIYPLLIAVLIGSLSCSSTRETVRADPQDPQYEPLRNKTDKGYNNTPGSQNREVRQDINSGRELNIKSDK